MNKNKEILDKFGETLVRDVFDFNYKMLSSNIAKNLENKQLDKKIKSLSRESISSILFDFLRIFEENEEFKLYYEKNGEKINLNKASEMLKAELIIENGWIDRFSNVVDKN
ncbi:hypothetical protein [Aquimarina mytili]|uniref:Uncharacterized protein n=1 Tax=Aquimarina mytili TaxID=874423 RepID=A0A937A021_9FLAO|nr:hypothetical protein [Aquimarina mytili]MBL0684331.1 hypothetical protein [Aquimarina mytili]